MSNVLDFNCPECNRAGVRRPHAAPLGQTLHGRELEDYWKAREDFWATVQRLKMGTKVEAQLRKLVGDDPKGAA